MAWELSRDIMILIIGLILTWVQLRQSIGKQKYLWGGLLVALLVLGTWQIIDTYNEKISDNNNRREINRMSNDVDRLILKISHDSIKAAIDSTNRVRFETRLFEEFKIIKDSNNVPKKVDNDFNTSIDKARDVYIGPRQ